ncbi:MAG: divalent-cation tolerance protein CutA [Gammaproteobacteria bacterium]|nr:divalent-cation tolerance protein CutA [Gammaproteobacteria bacterium]
MPNDDYIIVLSTCNSSEMASSLAENLVSNKLAACVNIVNGVESVYQWQDKLARDKEILLIIKTRKALFTKIKQMIQKLHDYELPEIIAVPVAAGEKNYLDWIKSATIATEI